MATFNYMEVQFKDGLGVVQTAPDEIVDCTKQRLSAQTSAGYGGLVRVCRDAQTGLTVAALISPKRISDAAIFGESRRGSFVHLIASDAPSASRLTVHTATRLYEALYGAPLLDEVTRREREFLLLDLPDDPELMTACFARSKLFAEILARESTDELPFSEAPSESAANPGGSRSREAQTPSAPTDTSLGSLLSYRTPGSPKSTLASSPVQPRAFEAPRRPLVREAPPNRPSLSSPAQSARDKPEKAEPARAEVPSPSRSGWKTYRNVPLRAAVGLGVGFILGVIAFYAPTPRITDAPAQVLVAPLPPDAEALDVPPHRDAETLDAPLLPEAEVLAVQRPAQAQSSPLEATDSTIAIALVAVGAPTPESTPPGVASSGRDRIAPTERRWNTAIRDFVLDTVAAAGRLLDLHVWAKAAEEFSRSVERFFSSES